MRWFDTDPEIWVEKQCQKGRGAGRVVRMRDQSCRATRVAILGCLGSDTFRSKRREAPVNNVSGVLMMRCKPVKQLISL